MTEYELMVIVKPLLPEDVRNSILEKIEKSVKSKGGDITHIDTWGKKHLSYKIKKHDEGYYVIYNFSLNSDSVNTLSKELSLMQEILRYLLLRKDEV